MRLKLLLIKMLPVLLLCVTVTFGASTTSATTLPEVVVELTRESLGNSLKHFTQLCSSRSDGQSLVVIGRVLDSNRRCRQPLSISEDNDVEVTYAEDSNVICQGHAAVDVNGVFRVLIPLITAHGNDPIKPGKSVKVCVRGVGCAERFVKIVTSPALKSHQTDTRLSAKTASALPTNDLEHESSSYSVVSTPIDWCLEHTESSDEKSSGSGLVRGAQVPNRQHPIVAASKRWDDVGMDWMKRTHFSIAKSAGTKEGVRSGFGITTNGMPGAGVTLTTGRGQGLSRQRRSSRLSTTTSRDVGMSSDQSNVPVSPIHGPVRLTKQSYISNASKRARTQLNENQDSRVGRENWNKKESWDASVMGWMKRENKKRDWDDTGMAWLKRANDKKDWEQSGMSWIKRNVDKRDWEDSGMAWIKRDDGKGGLEKSGMAPMKINRAKRDWDHSDMAWLKRNTEKRDWDQSGMAWIKKNAITKKFDEQETEWIKRQPEKKDWEQSGMAWIKRDPVKRDWDHSDMAWLKRDIEKKDSDQSGIAWIKMNPDIKHLEEIETEWVKRSPEKKDWEQSGMAWIKKNVNLNELGDHETEWVKRNPEKKDWEQSGMAWIKKDANTNPLNDHETEWVKRNPAKKDWDQSGMAWIKRDPAVMNLQTPDTEWVKRDVERRDWEQAGMAWIKRDTNVNIDDIETTPSADKSNDNLTANYSKDIALSPSAA